MNTVSTIEPTDAAGIATLDREATELAESELLEDELLVEEISIDGMCGVY